MSKNYYQVVTNYKWCSYAVFVHFSRNIYLGISSRFRLLNTSTIMGWPDRCRLWSPKIVIDCFFFHVVCWQQGRVVTRGRWPSASPVIIHSSIHHLNRFHQRGTRSTVVYASCLWARGTPWTILFTDRCAINVISVWLQSFQSFAEFVYFLYTGEKQCEA